ERLHDQLDAGRVAGELVRAEPDWLLLEAVVADFLDVLLRHDPARARREGTVERHEIGKWLVQVETHARRTDDFDLAHAILQHLADLRSQEAELHVVRGEGISIVELQTLAQLEVVDALIRAHGP